MLGTNYRMWFSKSRYFWKAFLKEMISDSRNNSKWELDSLQLNLVTIIIHLQLLISPKEVTHLSSCYKYHIPNTLDLTSRYKECWAMSLKFKNLLPNLPFWDLLCLWWLSVNSKRISCRYLLIFSWWNTKISKQYCKLKSSKTKFLCTKTFFKNSSARQ